MPPVFLPPTPNASMLSTSQLRTSQLSTSELSTVAFGPFPLGFVTDDQRGLDGSIARDGLKTLLLERNTRGYLVEDFRKRSWNEVEYRKLNLLGKSLRWTVDLSDVDCGCNAALYLVGMDQPDGNSAGYCDIQDSKHCLEIDLMEANRKALQTTLHTQTGASFDGTCNQYGCSSNWGKHSSAMYGQGSGHAVDSSRPYDMVAAFDEHGHMTVSVSQDGSTHTLWDTQNAGNYPQGSGKRGVPEAASAAVRQQMKSKGVVLVASLWGGGDMSWMDGGCGGGYQQCRLDSTHLTLKNLRVDGWEPTPPQPPVPPSPPKPPPSPPVGQCSLHEGLNCYGNDLAEAPCTDADACCDRCRTTAGCVAFTHNQWDPHGQQVPTCYLKTACSDRRQDAAAVSGFIKPSERLADQADLLVEAAR